MAGMHHQVYSKGAGGGGYWVHHSSSKRIEDREHRVLIRALHHQWNWESVAWQSLEHLRNCRLLQNLHVRYHLARWVERLGRILQRPVRPRQIPHLHGIIQTAQDTTFFFFGFMTVCFTRSSTGLYSSGSTTAGDLEQTTRTGHHTQNN